MRIRRILKSAVRGGFLLAALPSAAASGFGRWRSAFSAFAQAYALAPGLPGDYLRIAFYKLTLAECSLDSRISFGSFFAHPDAKLGPKVYIGSYCIIGKASIGANTLLASGVQVLSGARQHGRDGRGDIWGAGRGSFISIDIGSNCWIGAGAIVMANVGNGTTIGAGSVVTRPIPPASVAMGSPARVVRAAAQS